MTKAFVSPKHPYYPKPETCPYKSKCKKYKNGLIGRFFNGAGCDGQCNDKFEFIQNVVDNHDKKHIRRTYKKFNNGASLSIYDEVESNKSDFKDLLSIGRFFAEKKGFDVDLMPRVNFKSHEYQRLYGKLIGTIYEKKCPDLLIGDKFFEYEGYTGSFKKEKIGRMLTHGAKQSPYIIINNSKGCSHRFLKKSIMSLLKDKNFKYEIKEVYVYEKGELTKVY